MLAAAEAESLLKVAQCALNMFQKCYLAHEEAAASTGDDRREAVVSSWHVARRL